jgi:hypothetical protein
MSPLLQPIHQLAGQLREHGPALLAGMPEPHDELMSLVWGPRFDREHALGLVARQPAGAAHALPALLAAADAFDALHIPVQRRLRDLIRRHRALSAVPQETQAGDRYGDEAVAGWQGHHATPTGQPAIAVRGQERQDWGMAEEAGQPWSIAPSGHQPLAGRTLPM